MDTRQPTTLEAFSETVRKAVERFPAERQRRMEIKANLSPVELERLRAWRKRHQEREAVS
jgi:hypothetical protein